ncbi:hypothetical protein TSOC_009047 [Tetrabaena socialis]|uniref:Uncharacterized protein n=1 Tax=Tetrabaena socialis TaxID=47790 RepID=A0A2J7ZWT8_9CHLO|nr:hypothetical protein TSOC_009047 [Tetrabaena socialis]|eukprot:PNH04726.1 hypothetical protein TSOC_009047 [Tetrabaena socialis]
MRTAHTRSVHCKAYGHGLGSTIHMMSFGLTMAIRMGRVFIHAGAPLQRTIFLSTEDTATLAIFKSWANWTVLHTDVSSHHEKISPMMFAAQMG